jgi:hypothetical protein
MERAALRDDSDRKANQARESFRLCSACRGDYEDPDVTAKEEKKEEEEDADEELSA